MFQLPLWFYTREPRISRDEIARRAEAGEAKFKDLLAVINSIDHFAFFNDLKEVMANAGLDIQTLLERDESEKIFEYLLTPRGLKYANLPKGLLKFHQYPDASRTAFEEHLVEAAEYVRDTQGICRLHFTVSQEHREDFEVLLQKVRSLYEGKYRDRFQVDFSFQRQSTDTSVDRVDGAFQSSWARYSFILL